MKYYKIAMNTFAKDPQPEKVCLDFDIAAYVQFFKSVTLLAVKSRWLMMKAGLPPNGRQACAPRWLLPVAVALTSSALHF